MKSGSWILLPNRLSLLRVAIGILIPIFLFWPSPQPLSGPTKKFWTLLGLFLFGVFTDFWDGWIARRRGEESALGRILDPTADKIFILGIMSSFAAKGFYPYWYLVPIWIREIAVTFCRIAWLKQGKAIGAERAGKLKLASHVVSVLFSFLFMALPSWTTYSLNLIFLIVALVLTVSSGFFFLRHNREFLKDVHFLRMVASLGVGNLRPVPGTYGTLLGLVFVVATAYDPLLHLLILSLFVSLAYTIVPRMNLAPSEDPLDLVIDEVCGILLAFWTVPLSVWSLLTGFCLFRFFDVTKVFPIQWIENRKGVHGIVLDDLAAGVYTWLILKLIFR